MEMHRNLMGQELGATLSEFAILIALIALVSLMGVTRLSNVTEGTISNTTCVLKSSTKYHKALAICKELTDICKSGNRHYCRLAEQVLPG